MTSSPANITFEKSRAGYAVEPGDDQLDPATSTFLAHRSVLFTVAYQMLGSATDAEDVLQETWLRWAGVDLEAVQNHRAYLVQIATRQALGRLRTIKRSRETYVGTWLPEPLLTGPDVADDIVLAESVSIAMLLVLETLAPTERAVFVLREVFDLSYDEIAQATNRSEVAVRQIAHRARVHVRSRRSRQAVSPAHAREVLSAFQQAVQTGEIKSLLDVLSPDVVLLGDGGGLVQTALAPVVGATSVAAVLARTPVGARLQIAEANGGPALTITINGRLEAVLVARVDRDLIAELYLVRNPEKLTRLQVEVGLSR